VPQGDDVRLHGSYKDSNQTKEYEDKSLKLYVTAHLHMVVLACRDVNKAHVMKKPKTFCEREL
jgi:hypothetical protein